MNDVYLMQISFITHKSTFFKEIIFMIKLYLLNTPG